MTRRCLSGGNSIFTIPTLYLRWLHSSKNSRFSSAWYTALIVINLLLQLFFQRSCSQTYIIGQFGAIGAVGNDEISQVTDAQLSTIDVVLLRALPSSLSLKNARCWTSFWSTKFHRCITMAFLLRFCFSRFSFIAGPSQGSGSPSWSTLYLVKQLETKCSSTLFYLADPNPSGIFFLPFTRPLIRNRVFKGYFIYTTYKFGARAAHSENTKGYLRTSVTPFAACRRLSLLGIMPTQVNKFKRPGNGKAFTPRDNVLINTLLLFYAKQNDDFVTEVFNLPFTIIISLSGLLCVAVNATISLSFATFAVESVLKTYQMRKNSTLRI